MPAKSDGGKHLDGKSSRGGDSVERRAAEEGEGIPGERLAECEKKLDVLKDEIKNLKKIKKKQQKINKLERKKSDVMKEMEREEYHRKRSGKH